MTTEQVLLNGRVLHSWKEIASYTGRGVRTIQRYESQYGFPVRRPSGTPRSAVLAFSHEIDAWLAKSPTKESSLPKPKQISSFQVRFEPIELLHKKAHLGHQRAESLYQRMERMQTLLCKLKVQLEHLERRRDSQKFAGGSS